MSRAIEIYRTVLSIGVVYLAFEVSGQPFELPQYLPKAQPVVIRPSTVEAAPTTPKTGPLIQFATPSHDFGRVSSSEVLRHTFVFTNTGNEKLVITSVQPACGCTATADWTREVEPGQTGSIPIQFNTAGFRGPVAKGITIVSNDRERQVTSLQLKANVWIPIEVSPTYAILNVTPDSGGGRASIYITNNMDTPVQMWGAQVNHPSLSVELRTNQVGKHYEVIVATVPPLKPGTAQSIVTLQTTYTNSPQLTAQVYANVQPQITVIPQVVNLPQAPLPQQATPIVTIINNTTNVLSLSNAAVSGGAANVTLREVQPGRYFTATLVFPPGFEAAPGQPLEFSVNTSNPKFSTLKVAINQPARPAGAPSDVPPQNPPAPVQSTRLPSTGLASPAPTAGMKTVIPRRQVPQQPPAIPTTRAAAPAR